MPSTASDGKCSLPKSISLQNQEGETEVTSKRTKVLLIVLCLALACSLGGLCTLWTLYVSTLGDLQSAQETNRTITREIEELNINRSRVQLSECVARSCNLSVNGWMACCGKLYLFSSNKLNWSSSRDACLLKGADLVSITSRSEQDILVSRIKVSHWIGLSDLDTEGCWVWVNNQTLNEAGVEFWFRDGQNEPDNWRNQDPSGENCASLGDSNGNFHAWFDASCTKKKRFICEKQ